MNFIDRHFGVIIALILGLIFFVIYGQPILNQLYIMLGLSQSQGDQVSQQVQENIVSQWQGEGNTPERPDAAATAQAIYDNLNDRFSNASGIFDLMDAYAPQNAADVYDVFIAYGMRAIGTGFQMNLNSALNNDLSNWFSADGLSNTLMFATLGLSTAVSESQVQTFNRKYLQAFGITDIVITSS